MTEQTWSHRFSTRASLLFCLFLGIAFTLCCQFLTGQFGTPLTFIGLLIVPPISWLLLEPFRRRLRLSTGYLMIALPSAIAVGCGLYLHYVSDLLRRQQTFMEMQASGGKVEERTQPYDNVYQKGWFTAPNGKHVPKFLVDIVGHESMASLAKCQIPASGVTAQLLSVWLLNETRRLVITQFHEDEPMPDVAAWKILEKNLVDCDVIVELNHPTMEALESLHHVRIPIHLHLVGTLPQGGTEALHHIPIAHLVMEQVIPSSVSDLACLQHQENLEGIRLIGDITPNCVRSLQTISSIGYLSLHPTFADDDFCMAIAKLKNLARLDLHLQSLPPEFSVDEIGFSSCIHSLCVYDGELTESLAENLAKSNTVRFLNISHVRSTEALKKLSTMTSLKEFWMGTKKLNDEQLEVLESFNSLHELVVLAKSRWKSLFKRDSRKFRRKHTCELMKPTTR